jgi:hypothetical protein
LSVGCLVVKGPTIVRPRMPSGCRTPAAGPLVRPGWPQGCHDASASPPASSLRPSVSLVRSLAKLQRQQCHRELRHRREPAPLRLYSTTRVRGSTASSSTLATSLLSQRSPGEAALPSSLPRVPHRSTTMHAPSWRSPFGAFLFFLSSVAGSSCSPDARAKPNRTATGRR